MSDALIIYLAVVGAATLLVTIRIIFWLRANELRSLRRFERLKKATAIQTPSPLDDPAERLAEQKQSIKQTFSVTRRLLLPLLWLFAALLVGVPFVGTVPATLVTLIVGAVTIVTGIVLRPFIENSIAGLVISTSKQLNVGDTLSIDSLYGTVEDITLTHTTIKLWDWRRYVVSNSRMLQTEFVNHSLFDSYVWACVEFWVDYRADLEEVVRIAHDAVRQSDAFAAEQDEPHFWLIDTAPDGVLCWVAGWANSPAKAWQLKHEIRWRLIPELARRGWAPRAHRLRIDGGPDLVADRPSTS